VAQNIFIASEPHQSGVLGRLGQVDIRQMNRQAEQVLNRVGSKVAVTRRLSTLTVAQQQLVEIAKALSAHAKILLMDEPTSSLSEEQAENLLRLIQELRAQGLGIVFTTHRLPEAFKIADRFAVLRDGKLVANVQAAETTAEKVIQWMVGRPLDNLFPKPEVKVGETVLSVRSLSGGMVKEIEFSLRRGEILGFAGLVGAGRTETARLLFGADKATTSEVTLEGRAVHIRSPKDAVKLGIGYVPEDRKLQSLFLDLAVRHNAALAGLPQFSWHGVIRPKQVDTSIRQYVKRLNIHLRSPNQKVRFLSGGNQQKVVLSKWLMLSPRVLILDEPTRGIDVGAKAEIYELIGELARAGIGIILISSEMPELLGLSDRIVVMSEGRIVNILDRSEATQERIMTYASAGHAIA
jgi:ABC-type sugar transport system ATPase subunit